MTDAAATHPTIWAQGLGVFRYDKWSLSKSHVLQGIDLAILDEPVASLDPLSRRDFMRVLFSLRNRQALRTVLISSHLLSDLERVVTHVLFLREGRVQLYEDWDDCAEHLRVQACPERPLALPLGAMHWSASSGGRLLVDTRQCDAGPGAQALGMEDLMEVLNT